MKPTNMPPETRIRPLWAQNCCLTGSSNYFVAPECHIENCWKHLARLAWPVGVCYTLDTSENTGRRSSVKIEIRYCNA